MRWRLIAALVGITLIVLVVHDLPLTSHLRNVERNAIITGLERDAFTIAARAEEDLQKQTALANEQLQALVDRYTESEGARVVITDTDGTAMVISEENGSAGSDYADRPEIQTALVGTPVAGTGRSDGLESDLLYVAVPVRGGEQIRGAVRITYPAEVVDDRVAERVRGIAVVALISLLTAAFAAFALAGTVTRPLRRLTAATEDAARGNLSVRAPTDEGPPEIRNLAASFNMMSEQVSNVLEEQRAFASDASHQLRTPLTALRIRLEQAAEVIGSDPDAAHDRIDSASAEVERLQRMVEGLLALARAEGSSALPASTDLARIAVERCEVWMPLAEEQGVRVTVSAPGRLEVLAIPGALEQIIDNYIDNALGVAPSDTTIDVTVSVDPSGRTATVSVADRGPGMTQDQIDRAFDRFWRPANAPSGGSGLGLAVVRQLARASGGTATLTRRPGGGLVASATVPIATGHT